MGKVRIFLARLPFTLSVCPLSAWRLEERLYLPEPKPPPVPPRDPDPEDPYPDPGGPNPDEPGPDVNYPEIDPEKDPKPLRLQKRAKVRLQKRKKRSLFDMGELKLILLQEGEVTTMDMRVIAATVVGSFATAFVVQKAVLGAMFR